MIFQVKIRSYSSKKNEFVGVVTEEDSREAVYERLFAHYKSLSKKRTAGFKRYVVMREITDQQAKQLTAKSHRCLSCGSFYSKLDILNRRKHNDQFCSMDCRSTYFDYHESLKPHNRGYIYAITYEPTGQVYIGKTSKVFTTRWFEHVFESNPETFFHQLLSTTPIQNWNFKILAEEPNSKLGKAEQIYIKKYSKTGKCLNIMKGRS